MARAKHQDAWEHAWRDRYDPQPEIRLCDHKGCTAAGEFRAPKSRSSLNEFYWFCLEHVREYNKAWNYFDGMNDSEVEQHVRQDTVWGRETWRLGGRFGDPASKRPHKFHDPFDIFEDEEGGESDAQKRRAHAAPKAEAPEVEALEIMELDYPTTLEDVRKRYKELAKKLHPDANGGDPVAEECLKDVNRAYTTLRKWLS